MVDDRYSI
jgi:hypothetical protein